MKLVQKAATVFVALVFSFSSIIPAFGQSGPLVLGELQSRGNVMISTSTGEWQKALPTYPVLQKTGLRTEDGTALMLLRGGSRIEIAKNSSLLVDGSAASYSMDMSAGSVAFSVDSNAAMTIATPHTTVTINSSSPPLQQSGRVLGVVTVSSQGTEVKGLSGRIVVNHAGGSKVLAGGEHFFSGGEKPFKVVKVQSTAPASEEKQKQAGAVPPPDTGGSSNKGYVIGGLLVVGGIVVAVGALGGGGGGGGGGSTASPSGF